MKKHNRNVFAYVRHNNIHQNDESSLNKATEVSCVNHNIYNDIMDNLEPDQNQYIKKILYKSDIKEKRNKANEEKQNKVEVKVKADNFFVSPEASPPKMESKKQIEWRKNISQIENKDQKLKKSKYESHKKMDQAMINQKKTFINDLGSYIQYLSTFSPNQNLLRQRKTVLKISSKPTQTQILQDLNHSKINDKYKRQNTFNKNQYQLLIADLKNQNEALTQQNIYLKNKLRSIKNRAVSQIQKCMVQNLDLKNERDKQNIELVHLRSIFNDFHEKFNRLHENKWDIGNYYPINTQKVKNYENYGNIFESHGQVNKNRRCDWGNKKYWRNNFERRAQSNLIDFEGAQYKRRTKILQKEPMISDFDEDNEVEFYGQ